jgi:hypothetical protein
MHENCPPEKKGGRYKSHGDPVSLTPFRSPAQATALTLEMEWRAVIGDGAPSITQGKSPQSPGVEPGQAIEQTQKSSSMKQTLVG